MNGYKDLFQIGEVAALCGITRRMILNYEDMGLITPFVVNASSGYRYYDILTVSRIQMILDLRQVGMSLPQIRAYLTGSLSVESRVAALEEQRKQLDFMIAEMKLRTVRPDAHEIRLITVPEACCLCTDYVAADIEDGVLAYAAAYEDCIRQKAVFAPLSYHFCEFPEDILSENFFKTENIPMRICVSVRKDRAPENAVIYPACRALSLIFCGGYEELADAYSRIVSHILQNRCEVTGYPRELYMEGFFSDEQKSPLTQIVVPVRAE